MILSRKDVRSRLLAIGFVMVASSISPAELDLVCSLRMIWLVHLRLVILRVRSSKAKVSQPNAYRAKQVSGVVDPKM